MLVIDDSKLNLLKMKEKLLELSPNNLDKYLDDYHKLVLEIDEDCYQMILKEIKDSNYNNLPFEEKIKVFADIINDYNYLNELQHLFRRTFSKYSNEELNLSPLDNIMIDEVQSKKSMIEGYLMNSKNLNSNKIEVDKLNQELINDTKEQEHNKELIKEIRRKLKDDIFNAKGRILKTDGSLEITSIAIELKKYDIDLNTIIDDSKQIDELYGEAIRERKDAKETLSLALSIPNKDEKICKEYAQNLLSTNYKFNLVELIKEAINDEDNYYLFKDNLYKIEDLLREIKNSLRELDVKFYINPFDHIKIKDYIKEFEKTEDKTEEINKVKATIDYVMNMIDDMERANNEFLLSVGNDIDILKENVNTIYVNFDKEEETPKVETQNEPIKVEEVKENQVVKVTDISEVFQLAVAKEKANEVIKRINERFNPQKEEDVTTPELIIEKATEEVIPEIKEDLFNEVTPFAGPVLFDDRQDNGIFGEKQETITGETVKEKPEDTFWATIDEEKNHSRR